MQDHRLYYQQGRGVFQARCYAKTLKESLTRALYMLMRQKRQLHPYKALTKIAVDCIGCESHNL